MIDFAPVASKIRPMNSCALPSSLLCETNLRSIAIRVAILIFLAGKIVASSFGQTAAPVLLDLQTLPKPAEVTTPAKTKAPAGTAELTNGKFGKALQLTFIESTGAQFFTARINPPDNVDQSEGFSFWVKGDGSKNCGGLEFIDGEDFKLRYGYCFPIQSTNWTKLTVAWSDLIPELSGPLLGTKTGFPPSKFRNLWLGKWWYWREHPAVSFSIDHIVLESKIAPDKTDYTPKQPGLARVLAKLKARQPVTIVTMGDSLSDKRHWANRPKLWSEEVVKKLKENYGGEVTLVNPAIGGTTLSQNTILIPRWLQDAPAPDLVTIWFGFNDWDDNIRGPLFKEYLRLSVNRVRRATKGQADILLLTTCPSYERWETMQELAVAVQEVAQEQKTGLVDIAAEFHKVSAEKALQQNYFARDKVHLGAQGHAVVRDAVLRALTVKE